jgi:hypothetical protein
MIKEYINDTAVRMTAEINKDLIRNYDNYRAKEVYCPLSEESYWSETEELPQEEITE